MEQIGKKELIAIRTALQDSLRDVGKSLGVQLQLGSGKYSGSATGHFKLLVNAIDNEGEVKTEYASNYLERCSWMSDIKAEWLGGTFTHGGDTYTIMGWNNRGRKYQVVGRASNGTEYTFTKESLVNGNPTPKKENV